MTITVTRQPGHIADQRWRAERDCHLGKHIYIYTFGRTPWGAWLAWRIEHSRAMRDFRLRHKPPRVLRLP